MRTLSRSAAVACGTLALCIAPSARAQQVSLDRTAIPPAGPTPEFHLPTWSTTKLANGATLVVAERHALPLVSFSINFVGGADQYEPANETGLASMVASMLSEGTTTRTGDQLSNALQLLGTDVRTSIGGEQGSISFLALKENLGPTLALVEDMMVHPSFPDSALERLRGRLLVSLEQAQDRTSYLASEVFPKIVYGEDHPYGRTQSAQSVRAVSRADLVRFHDAYFTPAHAVITVVGDVTPGYMTALLNRIMASWKAGGSMPSFTYPALPAARPTTIYIVDKPGAAQSSFAIAEAGPPRSTPDYAPLSVMNTMFGGLFQSRINLNIREQHGYSYGVNSRFAFGRGPGAIRIGGDVVTSKTDSSLIQFMKEIHDIRGARPLTPDELQSAKNALVQSLPQRFSSDQGVNSTIASLYVEGLPANYSATFAHSIDAVTSDDVTRVARKYLDPAHMAIVIAGDRKQIEAPLTATGIAPVIVVDIHGNPVAGPTP
jgi:zinc protease